MHLGIRGIVEAFGTSISAYIAALADKVEL
jgi:hypothetical protein